MLKAHIERKTQAAPLFQEEVASASSSSGTIVKRCSVDTKKQLEVGSCTAPWKMSQQTDDTFCCSLCNDNKDGFSKVRRAPAELLCPLGKLSKSKNQLVFSFCLSRAAVVQQQFICPLVHSQVDFQDTANNGGRLTVCVCLSFLWTNCSDQCHVPFV